VVKESGISTPDREKIKFETWTARSRSFGRGTQVEKKVRTRIGEFIATGKKPNNRGGEIIGGDKTSSCFSSGEVTRRKKEPKKESRERRIDQKKGIKNP